MNKLQIFFEKLVLKINIVSAFENYFYVSHFGQNMPPEELKLFRN